MSFSKFLQLTQNAKKPFVVRNCCLFSHQNIDETFEKQETQLSSYDQESELFLRQTVETVKNEYLTKSLTKNHYDTPVNFQGILSREWQKEAIQRLGRHQKQTLTWIWTPPQSVTGFHQDPVYGQINGAWMWLVEGRKCWWFIDPSFSVEKVNINKMSIEEVRAVIGDLPILNEKIGKNDLIWFPNRWIHRVETTDWSFGFGGYF